MQERGSPRLTDKQKNEQKLSLQTGNSPKVKVANTFDMLKSDWRQMSQGVDPEKWTAVPSTFAKIHSEQKLNVKPPAIQG